MISFTPFDYGVIAVLVLLIVVALVLRRTLSAVVEDPGPEQRLTPFAPPAPAAALQKPVAAAPKKKAKAKLRKKVKPQAKPAAPAPKRKR